MITTNEPNYSPATKKKGITTKENQRVFSENSLASVLTM